MNNQVERDVAKRRTASKPSFASYGGTAPENYERYFVPAIRRALAANLVEVAALAPGEGVLDVACGTGIVARLAAERVGRTGTVAGLDINPGMLAVARTATPSRTEIDWYEAPAQAAPVHDGAFDVALCQMGMQFFPDKVAALREMHRVLVSGGRIALNVPGPIPELFTILADALTRHISPDIAPFLQQVFSLHDTSELHDLIAEAGFNGPTAERTSKTLPLPSPAAFLWQYVRSTPLAAAVAEADDNARDALEHECVASWEPFAQRGVLMLDLEVIIATATK